MKKRSTSPPRQDASRDFNQDEELAAIERRYQYARDNVQFTLPMLRRNRTFMQVYDRLIAKGWKDWHVVLAVGNLVNNYQLRVTGNNRVPDGQLDHWRKRSFERFFTPERQEDPRPPVEEFSDDKMEFALDMAIASMLQGKGWQLKNPTPNLKALRRFAAERYKFFDLDVKHEPFFRGVE
jgi:hypothetical protein